MRTNGDPPFFRLLSYFFRSQTEELTIDIIGEFALWTLISFISYRPAKTSASWGASPHTNA